MSKSMAAAPVALITGGTRGIGLGIARALSGEGYRLALNGLRPVGAVRDILGELGGQEKDLIYCRGDIGCAADRKDIIEAVMRVYGDLHLLVNNAGVAPKMRLDILETSEESFERVIKTNLQGAFFLSQAAANLMIRNCREGNPEGRSIINISSISATVASAHRGEYCIAKAGLSMTTQLFATRLGEYDIPVYEVRPGIIKTDMTAGVAEKYGRLIAEGLCVQSRWGLPEDVGSAVAALARGDFPYSTGQVIMVDGGLTLRRL